MPFKEIIAVYYENHTEQINDNSDGGSMFLRNVGIHLQVHGALKPLRHFHRRENLKSHTVLYD
jgi:hypothetical protein